MEVRDDEVGVTDMEVDRRSVQQDPGQPAEQERHQEADREHHWGLAVLGVDLRDCYDRWQLLCGRALVMGVERWKVTCREQQGTYSPQRSGAAA